MSSKDTTQPQRFRRARRWLVSAGLVIVLGACVFVVVAINLSRQAPVWWRSSDPTDPQTIEIGEQVETGVVNRIYEVREDPDAPWGVNIHAADANAWLNTRLQQWLASKSDAFSWPSEVEDVQVEFDEGLIQLGVRVSSGDSSRVYTLTLRPEVHSDGSLWVTALSVQVGRLPIPADWVLEGAGGPGSDLIPERLRDMPETVLLFGAFAGERPLRDEPTFELGDGRRVRLLQLASTEGRLHVQCLTEFE